MPSGHYTWFPENWHVEEQSETLGGKCREINCLSRHRGNNKICRGFLMQCCRLNRNRRALMNNSRQIMSYRTTWSFSSADALPMLCQCCIWWFDALMPWRFDGLMEYVASTNSTLSSDEYDYLWWMRSGANNVVLTMCWCLLCGSCNIVITTQHKLFNIHHNNAMFQCVVVKCL